MIIMSYKLRVARLLVVLYTKKKWVIVDFYVRLKAKAYTVIHNILLCASGKVAPAWSNTKNTE